MPRPLEGIRVLELASWVFGPHMGRLLADMGAEVIKVEDPRGGDPARGLVKMSGWLPVGRFNFLFEHDNRNKRSIAVNLLQDEGREIIYKLLPKTDVFLTNVRVAALRRLGMDYETMASIHPELIYCLLTGWGLKGAEKDSPAFDYVAFAKSGIMGSMGEPDAPPPQQVRALGDLAGASMGAYGTLLALFHRERTGVGQLVHVSLLGAEIEMGGLNIQATLATGLDVPRECRKKMLNPLCNCYRAKDGRWIQLYMPQSDPYWSGFCRVMGIEHLEHDHRFESMAKRMEHSEELIAILDGIFVTRTTAEWKQRDQEVELVWQVVNSFAEAAADPQVSENEYVMDFDHPTAGWIKMVGFPVQLSKTPGKITAAAPELGQHTEEIMQELGYTWDEIVRLKDERVIL